MYGTRLITANQGSTAATDAVITKVDHVPSRALLTSAGGNLPAAVAGDVFLVNAGELGTGNNGPVRVISVDTATEQWTVAKLDGSHWTDKASGTVTVQITKGLFESANQDDFRLELVAEVGGTLVTVDWEGSQDGENWIG